VNYKDQGQRSNN